MSDPNKTKKKYTYFVGVDVSKYELDYAVVAGENLLFHEEGKNETEDINAFLMKLKKLPRFTIPKAIFCMEHSGIYTTHIVHVLKKMKANIVLENPLQIKNSFGLVRGKDDKTDAIRIAMYAKKNCAELHFWKPRRPVLLTLMNLFALRNQLLKIDGALAAPLREQMKFIEAGIVKVNLKLSQKSRSAIKEDLAAIELCVDELIKSDEHLSKLFRLITSVSNIGRVTAIQIIIATNEFKTITDPRKFACYAGVAPFKRESGTITRRSRVSHIANKKMKALLHICALSALNNNPEIKAYYQKKTLDERKNKLSVINAIRFKLILRVFACLRQNREYIKDYTNSNLQD